MLHVKGGVQSVLGGATTVVLGGAFWGGRGQNTRDNPRAAAPPPNPTPLRDGTPEVVQALCPPPSPKKTPSPSPPPLSTVVIWGGGEKLGLIQGMVGRGGEKKKKNPNPKIYQTPKIYPNTKIYPVPSSCPWWGWLSTVGATCCHPLPPPAGPLSPPRAGSGCRERGWRGHAGTTRRWGGGGGGGERDTTPSSPPLLSPRPSPPSSVGRGLREGWWGAWGGGWGW